MGTQENNTSFNYHCEVENIMFLLENMRYILLIEADIIFYEHYDRGWFLKRWSPSYMISIATRGIII